MHPVRVCKRIRFVFRGLALFVAVACIFVAAVLIPQVFRYVREWQAMRVIEDTGGTIQSWAEGSEVRGFGPRFSNNTLCHCDRIQDLYGLTLCQTAVTDEGLSNLEKLDELGFLAVHDTSITGRTRCFRCLRTATRLTTVDLSGTGVSDVGLEDVSQAPNVTSLLLRRVTISATGLTHVATMTQLRLLRLEDATLPHRGASRLASLRNLVHLDVAGTNVTNDDLAEFKSLKALLRLELDRTAVTDQGVRHLGRLPGLSSLDLESTGITDEALRYVQDMEALEELFLRNTNVTSHAVATLRRARPEMKILFEGTEPYSQSDLEEP